MGYRFIGGCWTRRVSGQDADPDSEEDEIHAMEAGLSGIADIETEEDREPSTPPPPRATPSSRAAATPRPLRSSIDQTLRTEVQSLRDELHSLRDELRSSVGELHQEMTSGFASIMVNYSALLDTRAWQYQSVSFAWALCSCAFVTSMDSIWSQSIGKSDLNWVAS